MPILSDTGGSIDLPTADAAGDFTVTFTSVEVPVSPTAEILIGDDSTTNSFIAFFDSAVPGATEIGVRIAGNNSTRATANEGATISLTVTRVSGVVTITVNGADTPVGTVNGTAGLDSLFEYGNGSGGSSLRYGGTVAGTLTMIGFTGAGTRTYDLDGYLNDPLLVDTTSGENGTLENFTTGGYIIPPADTITITSVDDYECRQRNPANGQATFTIEGGYTGTPTVIEYRLDGGAWATLDAAPSGGTFTGNVVITNQQDIEVRFQNVTAATDSKFNLTAAACIAIGPAQSNAVSRIINAQVFPIKSGKTTPVMYKGGVFSQLQDPTGIDLRTGQDGSLWPYIAKRYSDIGIPVCIGNLAQGGTRILEWDKGQPTYYQRITDFANDCGGSLEFCISLIGESDSNDGTTTADFKSRYLQIATDIQTDFGCEMYAVYFPVASNTGAPADVAAIRLAYDQLIAENANIKYSGDLSVVDISTATDPLNDNLHIKTDAAALESSQIIYENLPYTTSTINVTLTGIPDGPAKTVFVDFSDIDDPIMIGVQEITYTANNASATVVVPVGSKVVSTELGNNPKTTGGSDYGVTV